VSTYSFATDQVSEEPTELLPARLNGSGESRHQVSSVATFSTSSSMADSEAGASAQWARAAERVPMRRWADPDEIGRVALFLASDLSSYVHGAQIVVDGDYLVA
jgi:NAD(P)-dependent dehydrogenase (short-subunit alcohol dehydrogenase family)